MCSAGPPILSILLFSNLGFGEEVYEMLQGNSKYASICFGAIVCILLFKWLFDLDTFAERTCWKSVRLHLMLIMMVLGGIGCVLMVDFLVWAPLAVFIVTMPAYFMLVFMSEREAMMELDEVSEEQMDKYDEDVLFDEEEAEAKTYSERSTIDQVIVFIHRMRMPQLVVGLATLVVWVLIEPPKTRSGDDDENFQGLCSQEEAEAEKLATDPAGRKTCMYHFVLWCAPLLVAGTLMEIALLSNLLALKVEFRW
jgi:hypothetical protein